jgi:hypothetical protein
MRALSLKAPDCISWMDALLMTTLKMVIAQKASLRMTLVEMSSMRISATAEGNTALGNSAILTFWNIICIREQQHFEIAIRIVERSLVRLEK